jgi:hypothetical protein
MNMNPTMYRRTVILGIQTSGTNQPHSNDAGSAEPETVVCIHMIVDDGKRVTEARLSGTTESDLMRGFWEAVQPDDVFFGRNVADRLNLSPSRQIDLRNVYQNSTHDPGGLRLSPSDAGFRSAGALAYLLGLPRNRPKPKKWRTH